jgi:hypothetical protein
MSNLYSIKTKRIDLARKFQLSHNRIEEVPSLPAIFPGHMAPTGDCIVSGALYPL